MELNIIDDTAETSYSQMAQDLWVLAQTNKKRNGFFVDFGATDGKVINNTYLLETEYGWIGIVAEPNPVYHADLSRNRPNSTIVQDAVFSVTGEKLSFVSAYATDLSTILGYGTDDEHAAQRVDKGQIITVSSISLFDMLELANAREHIDYMSVDTEGSEYDILKAFFNDPRSKKYTIDYITVEHNFTPLREQIYNCLCEVGRLL